MLWVGWGVFQFYVEQPVTGDILVNVPAVVACHCKLSVFQRLPDFFKLPEDISFVFPNTSSHHLKVDHWKLNNTRVRSSGQSSAIYLDWQAEETLLSIQTFAFWTEKMALHPPGPPPRWQPNSFQETSLVWNIFKYLKKQTSCF